MEKNLIRWSGNNFGDNLNDLIFKELKFDNKFFFKKKLFYKNLSCNTYLGLGTLITNKINQKIKVIGSGSDGITKPTVEPDYLFVRGKFTTKFLNLDKKLALGDTAYFLKDYIQTKCSKIKDKEIGIVPHWSTNYSADNIIPVDLPVDKFIYELSRYKIILAEAMHGAICADICRIPWSPIVIGKGFNYFKWNDWSSIFDLKLEFGSINSFKTYLSKDYQIENISLKIRNILETIK